MQDFKYAKSPPPESQIPPVVVRGWLHVIGMTIGMGLLWASILGTAFWLATNSLPKMYVGVCIGLLMSIFTLISQINRRVDEQELERLRFRLGHHTGPIIESEISDEPILKIAPQPDTTANSEVSAKQDVSSENEKVVQPIRSRTSNSRWSLLQQALPIPRFDKSPEFSLPKAKRRKFKLR